MAAIESPSVMVVGGGGYIGQVLSLELLKAGFTVTILDSFIHGVQDLSSLINYPTFSVLHDDITNLSLIPKITLTFDNIIFLSALVGEAACDKDPQKTLIINYLAPLAWWEAAQYYGRVKRFIFTSTDSCYGQRPGEKLTEDSPLKPISLYADLKARLEEKFLSSTNKVTIAPIVLRLATVYGLAPRMRFDLAVNLLTREACLKKKFTIYSGDQWRPLVHVTDAARAFRLALEAPLEKVMGQVFNVGSNDLNIQFKDLGKIILQCLPDSSLEISPGEADLRDYYVDFTKIQDILGFIPKKTLKDGVLELATALKNGLFADPYDKRYRNA